MATTWILLLCIAVHLVPSRGYYKKWVPNTNYDNPSNWAGGQLPCPNDALHFPESTAPVFMQTNISTTELVLPINGELVLGDNVMITFPSEHSNTANCPGKDVEFVRKSAKSWLDPDNWCEVASPEGDCLATQPSRLDTERLPCQYDDVIFPAKKSFSVDLGSGVDIYTGSLTLSGKSYKTDEFRSYVASKEGGKQFSWSGQGTLNIQQRACTDAAGCVCGNDMGAIKDKICEIQQPKCPDIQCDTPINVDGHCCPVCGAMLEVDYAADFKYSALYNALNYLFRKGNSNGNMELIVSRNSADRIIVVVQDQQGGEQAAQLALTMAQMLQQDIKGSKKYRITEVKLYSSAGGGPAAGALTVESSSLSTGSIAGIVLSVGALLAIIIICMICFVDRRQFRKISHTLSCFGKNTDEDQLTGAMELGPPSGFKDVMFSRQLSADLQSLPQGFDNPMYSTQGTANGRDKSGLDDNANTNPASEIDLSDVTFVRDKSNPQNTAFNNPMYGTGKQQDTKDEQSTQADEGFANPLYSENGNSDIMYHTASLKLNPVYSDEGVEEDSTI